MTSAEPQGTTAGSTGEKWRAHLRDLYARIARRFRKWLKEEIWLRILWVLGR